MVNYDAANNTEDSGRPRSDVPAGCRKLWRASARCRTMCTGLAALAVLAARALPPGSELDVVFQLLSKFVLIGRLIS